MSPPWAKTAEVYAEWGRPAVFEVGGLREGRCSFGCEDLPFMDVATGHASEAPCHGLLRQINDTYGRGLDLAPKAEDA